MMPAPVRVRDSRPAGSQRPAPANGPGLMAEVVIVSVFDSDLQFDRRAVKYLQVLTAEQLGNVMNANGGFRSRVIGTVPIESDGSVAIEVPANTPIHFQLLDVNEQPLVHETAFNTFAAGEVRSCLGCHEAKGEAPPCATAMPRAPETRLTRPSTERSDLHGTTAAKLLGDIPEIGTICCGLSVIFGTGCPPSMTIMPLPSHSSTSSRCS